MPKKTKQKEPPKLPELEQLQVELELENRKWEARKALRSIVFVLLVVTAAAVVMAVLVFPILQVKRSSMGNTLQNGDVIVTMNTSNYQAGDVIAFYYNNTLMIKRIVAVSGDTVRINKKGDVSVNGKTLAEPYVTEKVRGDCTVEFPYEVPEGKFFVLNDQRDSAIDSRNATLGCVGADQIVGKVLVRVWPFEAIGPLA